MGLAFELFGRPKSLSQFIAADSENLVRSFKFLCAAYALVFAVTTVIPTGTKYYLAWQYGVASPEVPYSDYAAAVNAVILFLLFGVISHPVFQLMGIRRLTASAVWQHYSYITGSTLIVGMFSVIALIILYLVAIFVVVRVAASEDLEIYKLMDLTFSFSVLSLTVINLVIAIGTYGIALQRAWGVRPTRVIVGVVISYVITVVLLYGIVINIDRYTGSALYELSGLHSLETLVRSLQKTMELAP